jgi:type I restriction enzyme R subunit
LPSPGKQNARIEHDRALRNLIVALLQDDTEPFKQFMDNRSFQCWLADVALGITSRRQVSDQGGGD